MNFVLGKAYVVFFSDSVETYVALVSVLSTRAFSLRNSVGVFSFDLF